MAEDISGAAEAPQQTDIIERSAGGEGPLSAREAALSLADTRHKEAARQRRDDEQEGSAFAKASAYALRASADSNPSVARLASEGGSADKEARDDAPVRRSAEREGGSAREESTAQAADAAQETGPGETQGDDQAEPSIAPPRSWTKEDKELFRHLPRETQERLAERERSREADFLRRQNEAADRLKGLSAQQQEADKARTHYEQALPVLLMELQGQQQGDFADITGIADLERLAREDWPRYVLWDAQQKKIAAIQQQVAAAQARQTHEQATRWTAFARDEDAKFLEKAPEFTDLKVVAEATQHASELLKELGFTEAELGQLWSGQGAISLRDHRMQLLLRDGVKYREALGKAKAAQQRPVPSVQRPGPAPARDADADDKVRSLNDRLTTSGTLRDAAALLVAQRRGA
jgi:hypothetical protein